MKNSKTFRQFFCSLLLAALVFGCWDMEEINTAPAEPAKDPVVFKVKIDMQKSLAANGARSQTIILKLFDQKGEQIALNGGKVTANGIDMELALDPFTHLPYYTIEENRLRLLANSAYTFKITSPGNKTASATIHTREKDLYLLMLPLSHQRTQPLTIKWAEADSSYPIIIKAVRTAEINGQVLVYLTEVEVANPGAGEYDFPPAFFSEYPGIYRVDFTISSAHYGQMDGGFMAGSYIRSEFSVCKSLDIQ